MCGIFYPIGRLRIVAQSFPGLNARDAQAARDRAHSASCYATAALAPARLALRNTDGSIVYSGVVADDATRDSIVNSLKAVFGAGKVTGALAEAPHTAAAAWLPNLQSALAVLKLTGAQALFEGNKLELLATPSPLRIATEFWRLSKSQFLAMNSNLRSLSDAASKPAADLSSLRSGFSEAKILSAFSIRRRLILRREAPRSRLAASQFCCRPQR